MQLPCPVTCLFTTKRDFVVSDGSIDLSDIRPSDHKKTDNRMRLRAPYCHGRSSEAFLRTVDIQIHILTFDIGKKTGWNAWMNFTEATETMISLINNLQQLAKKSVHMQCTEQLTVLCTVRAVPVLP